MSEELRLTELELGRVANNIQELLYGASDMCHDRCVKFLMARAKVKPCVKVLSLWHECDPLFIYCHWHFLHTV